MGLLTRDAFFFLFSFPRLRMLVCRAESEHCSRGAGGPVRSHTIREESERRGVNNETRNESRFTKWQQRGAT